MAWTWAVISRMAVTNASTAPTITPGTTSATTVSLRMTAQTRLRADGRDVWLIGGYLSSRCANVVIALPAILQQSYPCLLTRQAPAAEPATPNDHKPCGA